MSVLLVLLYDKRLSVSCGIFQAPLGEVVRKKESKSETNQRKSKSERTKVFKETKMVRGKESR
jgi:hypothetical protein